MERMLLTMVGIAMVVACSADRGYVAEKESQSEYTLSARQMSTLKSLRIFFGHQSVGRDILHGIEELAATNGNLKLEVVHTDHPETVPGPALAEFDVGANGDPSSKNRAFAEIVSRGIGQQEAIALFKYCYVDIRAGVDVTQVFTDYRRLVDRLQSAYPKLLLIHVTVPLTVVESGPRMWLNSALGRAGAKDDNILRNDYNRMLRNTYPSNRIFDLARVESTLPDGSRSFVLVSGRRVDTLATLYTDDGGHLNALGRRRAALELLRTLAEVRPSAPSLK